MINGILHTLRRKMTCRCLLFVNYDVYRRNPEGQFKNIVVECDSGSTLLFDLLYPSRYAFISGCWHLIAGYACPVRTIVSSHEQASNLKKRLNHGTVDFFSYKQKIGDLFTKRPTTVMLSQGSIPEYVTLLLLLTLCYTCFFTF